MSPADWLALAAGRLRATCLRLRGARVGRKATFGARMVATRPRGLDIGARAAFESDVFLKLVTGTATLSIGDSTFVGRGCEFDVMARVSVGSHTLIAPRCFITDHGHGTSAARRIDEQPGTPGPVAIGSDVWIGYGVVVLPGVTIGDGAVIGANSVVTADVEPMTVVAGAPARPLRRRDA